MAEEPALRIVSALDHYGRVPEKSLLFSDATDAECRLYAVLTTFDYRRQTEIIAGRKALVEATGWSMRKVDTALADLDARGAIRRIRQGRGHPNVIVLLADVLPPDDVQDLAGQTDELQNPTDELQNRVISPLIERELTRVPDKPAKTTAKGKTAMTDTWRPSERTRTWALETYPEFATGSVLGGFRDYHLAHGKRMTDWDRAFRNWIRNEAKWAGQREQRGPARTFL